MYIYELSITNRTLCQHVEALWPVSQPLQDKQLCLKESQAQFFSKRPELLTYILQLVVHSADPLRAQEIFDFSHTRQSG